MIKNITSYILDGAFNLTAAMLSERLEKLPFHPCEGAVKVSAGFTPVSLLGTLVEDYGHSLLIKLKVEKKSVPASVVKSVLNDYIDAYFHENGTKPSKGELKAAKDKIALDLLVRAFPKREELLAWINIENNLLMVATASMSKADDFMHQFLSVFEPEELPFIRRMETNTHPTQAMKDWILEEAPAGFTVDDECELRSQIENRPTIKYVRHSLAGDEIKNYLLEGKFPISLAMTFNEQDAFKLDSNAVLKSIKLTNLIDPSDELDYSGEMNVELFALNRLVNEVLFALDGITASDSEEYDSEEGNGE